MQSYHLQQIQLELVNKLRTLQIYGQLKICKKQQEAKKSSALLYSILKSVFATSDSFYFYITPYMTDKKKKNMATPQCVLLSFTLTVEMNVPCWTLTDTFLLYLK